MGCNSSVKVAKVEDNYQVSADNDTNNLTNTANRPTEEEEGIALETHNNNNIHRPSKSDGVLPTKSKANPKAKRKAEPSLCF